MTDRDLSVVVFGASGVTGRNVAAYLSGRAQESGDAWAVAGRDEVKMKRVLAELGVSAPESIAADVSDPDSLAEMARRTRVVIDLVGPYTLYGTPVIDACVANGAHYIDLTGEVPFVRRTIDAFHERAVEAGVKVVQVSGFEALPPDLAVLLAAETAAERWDERLAEIDVAVSTQQPSGRIGLGDLISGGTLQSMAEIVDSEGAGEVTDPAALLSDPAAAAEVRRVSPIALAPRFDSRGDAIAPMVPAAYINPAVIMRTADLLSRERGEELRPFRYREGITLPGGPASVPLRWAAASIMAGVQRGVGAVAGASPGVRSRLASLMRRGMPGSGFGPSGERIEEWSWKLTAEGRTDGGHHLRIELEADGHPGYLTTARMLGEAGLILATPGAAAERSGCLTPAAALGTGSIERFEKAGMRFTVAS